MLTTVSVFAAALAGAGAASASPLSTSSNYAPRTGAPWAVAPLVANPHPHGSLNSSYIVVFKDSVQPHHVENHMNFLQAAHYQGSFSDEVDAGLRQVYDGHIRGYAGKFDSATVDSIRAMPEVDYVEMDQIVRTMDIGTQKAAPWGLARISHRERLRLGTFTRYDYEEKGGEGVDVYIIDTGINIKHEEFQGRAYWGKTMPQNDVDEDGNGHGSHCAGTVASRKYGVAKAANVIAVKVLGSNGSGSMSDVVGGVVWAAQQAASKDKAAREEFAKTGKANHKGSVANMSLGGGKSKALDDAVNRAVKSGMHFAVAAGNDNKDACSYSPAAAENAVTVGASTLADERAYFSNHGPCVDVFAPGLNILSTWNSGPTSTNTISGTSMASPHTAGLLAYLLSIYPSKSFDPSIKAAFEAAGVPVFEQQSVGVYRSAYAAARAVLPSWMTGFLPVLGGDDSEFAPTPKEPLSLTPLQLKTALLALSTRDAITDQLPAGTPNLLIFNNATA